MDDGLSFYTVSAAIVDNLSASNVLGDGRFGNRTVAERFGDKCSGDTDSTRGR